MAKKKTVVENEVQTEFPIAVEPVTQKETPSVEVALDPKRSVVYTDEVTAIKDSRKRDLPLFKVVKRHSRLWDLLDEVAGGMGKDTELYHRVNDALYSESVDTLWIVAISEHQAKLAIINYAYPMEKVSKKDRDSRYLDLLEIASEAS